MTALRRPVIRAIDLAPFDAAFASRPDLYKLYRAAEAARLYHAALFDLGDRDAAQAVAKQFEDLQAEIRERERA